MVVELRQPSLRKIRGGSVSMRLSGVTSEKIYAIAQYPLSLPRNTSSTGLDRRGLGSIVSITVWRVQVTAREGEMSERNTFFPDFLDYDQQRSLWESGWRVKIGRNVKRKQGRMDWK